MAGRTGRDIIGAVEPIPYDSTLRRLIERNLAGHQRRTVDLGDHRHAAVAVVVVDSDASKYRASGPMANLAGGAAFVLCRRAAGLNRHASQWALPGGRVDDGETAMEAARRELDEELGVMLGPEAVLGLLDDYPTRSGYVITPVVLWGGGHVDLTPHPGEVLAAYRIGLHHLCRDDSPRFVTIPESDRPVVQVPLGRHLIHAPTGAVLVQFRWLALEGRDDPVSGFEQPVFAWR